MRFSPYRPQTTTILFNPRSVISGERICGGSLFIGKRSRSRYEAGKRSGAWVKIKLDLEQEFVIGGHTEPEGFRKHFACRLLRR